MRGKSQSSKNIGKTQLHFKVEVRSLKTDIYEWIVQRTNGNKTLKRD